MYMYIVSFKEKWMFFDNVCKNGTIISIDHSDF